MGIAGVEKQIVATKHHGNVQTNHGCGKQVERDASLPETLKEAGTHLQTYHEDEQYQSELLHESQDRCWGGEA